MPFLRIRLDSVDRLAAMDRQLADTLHDLNRPADVISTLIGHGPVKGWQRTPHRVWALFLLLLNTTSWLVLIFLQSWPALSLVTAGLGSHLLLLLWEGPSRAHRKALTSASNGAGVIRKAKYLQSITNISFSCPGLILSFFVVLHLLSIFGVVSLFPQPSPHLSLQLLSAFGVTLSALLIPAVNSLFFSYSARISSEYDALAHDFRHDVNAYQLAVCRHYLFAHGALSLLLSPIRRPISLWLSLLLLIDVSTFLYSLSSLVSSDFFDPSLLWRLFILAFVTIGSLVHIICLLAMCLIFRKSVKSIRDSLMNLMVGKMILHEQVYSLCTAFLQYLPATPGFMFSELAPISRNFVFMTIVLLFFLSLRLVLISQEV